MKSLIFTLFFIGIAVLTYDSLPYFEFSVYRPIAIFPMFAASMLLLFERFRFHQGDFFLIAFFIYSSSNSLIKAAVYNDLSSSIKHMLTLVIGISIYRVALYAGQHIKDQADGTQSMNKALMIAFVPAIIAGFMQFFDAFLVHNGFSKTLTSLFSEQVYHNRIQMLSGEPSWAALHMITGGLLIYYLCSKQNKKSWMVIALALLLIMTFSAYAYGVILIAFFIYMLINSKQRVKMIVVMALMFSFIFILVPFLIKSFGVSGYYTHRFNLDNLSIDYLMRTDNSFFVRFVFPMIGFIEFARHPLTGLGGGFYYREFADTLLQYFDVGLKFREVSDMVMRTPDMATSRNLYSKLFSEEGFIGVVLFFGFLVSIFRSCSTQYSKFVFAICLSAVMNFDSYAFIDFWLLIGLIRGGFFEPVAELPLVQTQRFSVSSVPQAQYPRMEPRL
ncbi:MULTISPECIES: O-antigen ligase family protein [Paenibacillus]|uniref:O-antigen ligase family protein n=1 Tax=Paenibacillus TaxID=44249 RepID=UPI0022B86E59|nr:O-antigen ligase family protein [Paenibacillus caseinilyticus]MCZ8519318.1 O-antigen ligase family protein [Paenibacillus caseinilyticus]